MSDFMVIVCPDGMGEGDALLVTTPSGEDAEILVPAGVGPGDEFEIEVDGPAEGEGEGATGDEPHYMVIVCPDGMGEGDALLVTTPSGEDVEILVPAGVGPGDEFEIEVDGPAEGEGEGKEQAEEEEGEGVQARHSPPCNIIPVFSSAWLEGGPSTVPIALSVCLVWSSRAGATHLPLLPFRVTSRSRSRRRSRPRRPRNRRVWRRCLRPPCDPAERQVLNTRGPFAQ